MKGGAVDFLTKPVDEIVLLAAIEQALQKDRSARLEAAEQADLLALPFADAPRAGSAAASGEGIVEQTGRSGVRNFRVHSSNSPGQHHAQDES